MGTPYLGEIKIVAFNFAPRGWAFCSGQTLSIQQNSALFSLLGTFYGGDGTRTFALPNLQGCVPIHAGNGFNLGQKGGEAVHTLTVPEMPAHTHVPSGSTADPTTPIAAGNMWAKLNNNAYAASPDKAMNPAGIGAAGGSQPHNNLSPFLVVGFVIALQGAFPSRN